MLSKASLIMFLMIVFSLPVDAQKLQTPLVVSLPVISNIVDDSVIPARGFVGYGASDARAIFPAVLPVGLIAIPAPTVFNNIDLEEFFRLGGTLELIAPADPDHSGPDLRLLEHGSGVFDLALRKHDLVISEIMWALDVDGNPATDNDRRQWIEIYNTMERDTLPIVRSADGVLKLRFVPFAHPEKPGDFIPASAGIGFDGVPAHPVENPAVAHVILDSVSNLQFVRWEVPGENGNTTPPRAGFVNDPPLKPLVSMYRNLDYVKIKGTHNIDATENRKKQLEGVPDGALPGSWKATPALGRRNTASGLYVGTPGAEHVPDLVFMGVTKTSIASDTVVINEVRNDSSPANVDWVELYNNGTDPVDLHGWELSVISGDSGEKTDKMLVGKEDGQTDEYRFPKGADWKLQPGAYLLIVNRHPVHTPLANGVNVDEVIAGKEVKAGASHQYIVREKLDLPNANITLLLRNNLEKNSHHKGDNKKWQTNLAHSEAIQDYAGTVSIEVKTNEYNTLVWPFRGWTKTAGTDGKDGEGIPNNSTNALARTRYQANDGHHKDAWANVGHKGGVGYDRGVDLKLSPGTPGYANDSERNALVDDKATADATDDVLYTGEISISEVMSDAGPRWNLIQWIELYNSSMTETVNLKDWELQIRNATDDVESYVDSGFTFNDAYILPNQTILLVSGSGTNDVSPNRVYNLYQHHRRELGLTNRRSVLLSPAGFYLKLVDKNGDVVDEVGNVMLDGAERNVVWELPMRNPDYRQSLVRQYGSRELYDGSADPADDGTMMTSWRQSDLAGAGISFYGHRDDASTPGYRLGGPLPVSLSKFRPVRNQETGQVDITWITESELNNAGFNILRSEAKNGEFQVINVKGIIAGHGTMSEQHVYKFTDTTAKPNVVYYYQIEDVSLNGHRTPLTTTRLKGHVGGDGKLITRWGELKSSGK